MEEEHKLGVCTWMFGELPLSEIARRLERLGFDGVELMGNLDLYHIYTVIKVLPESGSLPARGSGADPDRPWVGGPFSYSGKRRSGAS